MGGYAGFGGDAEQEPSLVAGSVRGLRTWSYMYHELVALHCKCTTCKTEMKQRIDSHDRPPWLDRFSLVGQFGGVWTAGENTAGCYIHNRHAVGEGRAAQLGIPEHKFRIAGITHPKDKAIPYWKCSCGFWAYWSPIDVPTNQLRIPGVVEGWGRTLIGEKGFRCEKAKIIALCLDFLSDPPPQIAELQDQVRSIIINTYAVPVFSSMRAMLEAFPSGER